ncbi:hypothetical protein M5689_005210 [Euphorbia peplus]|nr:hypothetical protein M5689_005210 [Euphorbia peplus]
MLRGYTEGLSEVGSCKDSELNPPEGEEILYRASFDELGKNTLSYDTVIWVSISLLLVLAWGVGLLMLLYLPLRRHVLKKDISSRNLFLTPTHIVYKVSRPSFLPFLGVIHFQKHIPLSLVIDIILEQGCLQSLYGIHTFRIQSRAHGRPAPVDELQVHGVVNPSLLRKVIITEAAKSIQDAGFGKGWKPAALTADGESMSRIGSLSEGPPPFKSPAKSWKMTGSPRYASLEPRSAITGEVFLSKLDEVSKSVKKLEWLIEKSQGGTESSEK